MKNYKSLIVLVGSLFFISSVNAQIADKDLSIRQILEKYYPKDSFYFGCTSKARYLTQDGNNEKEIFLREFSYNTPENEFKQSQVYPEPKAEWKAEKYRQLVFMARINKQTVRAHGPISPQCSKWVADDRRTAAELKDMMTFYMITLSKELEKNSDVVKWMDVVNETVITRQMDDSAYSYEIGNWFGPMQGIERWQNPWLIIGHETDSELRVPSYIKLAFEMANKYAPGILKLYNHHGGMEDAAWDKVKNTVLYLRSKGLKVDALGWQAHIPYGFENIPGNMEKLDNLIDWCYQNKLEFHVTELDVKMGKNLTPEIFKEKASEIADTYGAITEAMLKKMGKGAVSINCWTLTHRYRKSEGIFAGLYDNELNPTPAYFRVKELLLKYAPEKKD